MHICELCNKIFTKKSTYNYHINEKKRPCELKAEKIPKISSNLNQKAENLTKNIHQITPNYTNLTPKAENKCNYCGYKTERIDNYNRHKSSCKVKKQEISEKEEILNKLLEQNNKLELTNNKLALTIEELNKRIEKLENNNNKINHTQNNKNIKHQNNGISNTINIIGFGKEDLSKIDASFFEALMQLGYSIPTKMLEKIHNEK